MHYYMHYYMHYNMHYNMHYYMHYYMQYNMYRVLFFNFPPEFGKSMGFYKGIGTLRLIAKFRGREVKKKHPVV